jgi:peroxiredoxin
VIDAANQLCAAWRVSPRVAALACGLALVLGPFSGRALSAEPAAAGRDAPSAGASLPSLQAAYEAERQQFQQRIAGAASPADHEQIRRDMQARQAEYNRQALALARREPRSAESLEALAWILKNDFVGSADSLEALSMLTAHHLTDADLSEVCQRLVSWAPAPEAELFLRRAAESSNRRTQAAARFALVRSFQQQPERRAEVEPLLEELAAEFVDVPSARGSVAEAARAELFEWRELAVGQTVPQITGSDLEGEPLTLSTYRGHVVLLYFWGSWCPHCRDHAPRIRQLVERMRGQPFAVLGVDSDADPALARQFLAQQQLGFPNWYDGDAVTGAIASKWNVVQWPMTYLLDHQGVIRAKFQGPFPDNLERAVDQLVARVPRPAYANRTWPWLLGGGLLCIAVALFRFWRQYVPGPARLN